MSAISSGFSRDAFDPSTLPDVDNEFINEDDITEFAKALNAPESSPFVSLNDWKPVHQRVRRRGPRDRKRKQFRRSKDETRQGYVYTIVKGPLLVIILGWIISLGALYWLTRLYVWAYERLVTWRGLRQDLRKNIRSKTNFEDWKEAAQELDRHLGNEVWKEIDDYAYYDFTTVMKAKEQLRAGRNEATQEPRGLANSKDSTNKLRAVVEASVKNNFVGVENPRLYSETYVVSPIVEHLSPFWVFYLEAVDIHAGARWQCSSIGCVNFLALVYYLHISHNSLGLLKRAMLTPRSSRAQSI